MTLKVVGKKQLLSKWQNQILLRTHQVKQEIHLEEIAETIPPHPEKRLHRHQKNEICKIHYYAQ